MEKSNHTIEKMHFWWLLFSREHWGPILTRMMAQTGPRNPQMNPWSRRSQQLGQWKEGHREIRASIDVVTK